MKARLEQNSPLVAAEMVACEVARGRDFGCEWHFHRELELTYVVRGGSHRWIGDRMSAIPAGDIVLIGSNLPHDYRNDPRPGRRRQQVHAIVIQFHPDFLGTGWLDRANMNLVRELFQRAARGLAVAGRTREKVARRMRLAPRLKGLRRVALLLEILEILSRSRETSPLSSPGFAPDLQLADSNRMRAISSYIQEHITEPLYLRNVARQVGMTEVSLGRFFRSRSGKTFPRYVNELRIGLACRMLAETDQTVTETGYACGFACFPHFEEQFSRLQGCTPKAYRENARGTGGHRRGAA